MQDLVWKGNAQDLIVKENIPLKDELVTEYIGPPL